MEASWLESHGKTWEEPWNPNKNRPIKSQKILWIVHGFMAISWFLNVFSIIYCAPSDWMVRTCRHVPIVQEYASLWVNIQGIMGITKTQTWLVGSANSLLRETWHKPLHGPSSTVFELRVNLQGINLYWGSTCHFHSKSCSLRPSCCKTKIAGYSRMSFKKKTGCRVLKLFPPTMTIMTIMATQRGTSQFTRWKRRSKAASFSMCLVYLRQATLGEETPKMLGFKWIYSKKI